MAADARDACRRRGDGRLMLVMLARTAALPTIAGLLGRLMLVMLAGTAALATQLMLVMLAVAVAFS